MRSRGAAVFALLLAATLGFGTAYRAVAQLSASSATSRTTTRSPRGVSVAWIASGSTLTL